jgi:hypothetical protein
MRLADDYSGDPDSPIDGRALTLQRCSCATATRMQQVRRHALVGDTSDDLESGVHWLSFQD